MREAASTFWRALSTDQRARAAVAFDDDERLNWNYVPMARRGLSWKQMSAEQREMARALLRSGLSSQGYDKANAIMNVLEPILREREHNDSRDPDLYFFTIFGDPDVDGHAGGTWGWRVEGHHLSLNFTIVDGRAVSATPEFFGANPATVDDGPRKGTRVLHLEEDLGRQLVKSLDERQRKLAVISETAPREITTGNQRKIDPGKPNGIAASDLTAVQKQLLRKLVEEYAHRLRDELADQDLKKIDAAGFDNVHFAWAGGTEPAQGHYYRIQGPTFMVEYDNTQNRANHIHTVWRDPTNDFGHDALREHYEHAGHDHR